MIKPRLVRAWLIGPLLIHNAVDYLEGHAPIIIPSFAEPEPSYQEVRACRRAHRRNVERAAEKGKRRLKRVKRYIEAKFRKYGIGVKRSVLQHCCGVMLQSMERGRREVLASQVGDEGDKAAELIKPFGFYPLETLTERPGTPTP